MFNVLQNDTDDLACHLVKHDLNKKTKKITYKEIRKCWIWQHYNKIQNRKQCNICNKNYSACDVNILGAHLLYVHQIRPDEEIIKTK